MLHTKYHGSRPNGFRQEDFFMFLHIKAYVKPVTPEAGPKGPRAIIRTNLVEVYLMILHTKYQGSMPCGTRQEDFFHVAPYISLCKT